MGETPGKKEESKSVEQMMKEMEKGMEESKKTADAVMNDYSRMEEKIRRGEALDPGERKWMENRAANDAKHRTKK
jgi:alkylhydroperoxidase/carboxymuconolactone decarboxylase family protein YurZ